MYKPKPLREPSDTAAAHIATRALEGRLTIYAGAGLSASEPTFLPGARGLAARIAAELSHDMSFDGIDVGDLLAVADLVASQPLGLPLLRTTVLRVADLLGAPTNFGHEVVAMLLLEGAAHVFETNYDDCIERAAQPERLPTAVSNHDILNGSKHALLKAHGCALLIDSMLITSADLAQVPLWAETGVSARLGQDTVLFVGIGSVADYVKERLEDVLRVVGSQHIVLVDPALKDWGGEPPLEWEALLANLPEDQRDARGASEFLDAVLRSYTFRVINKVEAMVAGLAATHASRAGAGEVINGLLARDAVRVMQWLRAATWPREVGRSVVGAQATTQGLCALGTFLGSTWTLALRLDGWSTVTRDASTGGVEPATRPVLTLLVSGDVDGPMVARRARQRVLEAKRLELVAAEADVFVLVAGGYTGSLGLEELPLARGSDVDAALIAAEISLAGLPMDLLGDPTGDHLIDGDRSGAVYYINGPQIVEAQSA